MTYEVAREVSTGHTVVMSQHPSRAAAELAAIRYRRDRPSVSYIVLGGSEAEKSLNSVSTLSRYLAEKANGGNR